MDTLNHYRELIKAYLAEMSAVSDRQPSDVDTACVFDDEARTLCLAEHWLA